jgi:hypothetical protein
MQEKSLAESVQRVWTCTGRDRLLTVTTIAEWLSLTSVQYLVLDDPGGEVCDPLLLAERDVNSTCPAAWLEPVNMLDSHLQDLCLVQLLVALHTALRAVRDSSTGYIHIACSRGPEPSVG